MLPSKGTTRRRFIELVVSVAAVHVVAIGLYYAFDVQHAAARAQRIFGWIWMAITIVVILIGTQRLKRARGMRRSQP